MTQTEKLNMIIEMLGKLDEKVDKNTSRLDSLFGGLNLAKFLMSSSLVASMIAVAVSVFV